MALGAWYCFGHQVLETLRDGFAGPTFSEAQLWPEHFDLAVTATLTAGDSINIGFSPGDGFEAEPYVYVGPNQVEDLPGDYWNTPFGACLRYVSLATGDDPAACALAFITDGLELLAARDR